MPDNSFSSKLKAIGQQRLGTNNVPALGTTSQHTNRLKDIAQGRQKELAAPTVDVLKEQDVLQAARSGKQTIGDSLKGIASGLASGTAGAAQLALQAHDISVPGRALTTAGQHGTLIANHVLGTEFKNPLDPKRRQAQLAENTKTVTKFLEDNKSSNLAAKKSVSAAAKARKLAPVNEEFENSRKTPLDKLKRFSAEVAAETNSVLSSPALIGDTTSQALGSLLPSLLVTRGATGVASKGLSATPLSEGAKQTALKGVTAGSVGAIEGAGAFNDVLGKVVTTPFDQLEAKSQYYRDQIRAGKSPEEARLDTAHKAASKAQAIATPIAAVAGIAASKFEGGIPKSTSLRSSLKEIGGQTLEEAFQSTAGTFASNVGTKEFADNTVDTTKGLGEAAVQGAIGGFGATAGISSPKAVAPAVSAAKEGAAAVRDIAHEASQSFKPAGNAVYAKAREINPSLPETIGEASADVKAKVSETLYSAVNTVTKGRLDKLKVDIDKSNPTGNQATEDRISRMELSFKEAYEAAQTQEDLVELQKRVPVELIQVPESVPASIQSDVVEGSRLQTLKNVSAKLADGGYTAEAQAEASTYVLEELASLRNTVAEADTTENPVIKSAAKVIGLVLDNKDFSAGETAAVTNIGETEITADSSKAQVLQKAFNDPVNLDAKTIDQVLSDTSIDVTPIETKVLNTVRSVEPVAVETTEIAAPGTGKTGKSRAKVRDELIFSGFKDAKYGALPSFTELFQTALRTAANLEGGQDPVVQNSAGEGVDGRDSFKRMANLVQHQINKLAAAEQSLELGGNVTYDALEQQNGETFLPDENKIFVNAGSLESLETYKQIAEDTNTGIKAHNALIKNFGAAFNSKPIALVPVPDINKIKEKNDATVAQKEKEAAKTSQAQESTATVVSKTNDVASDPSSSGNSDVDRSGTPTSSRPELNQRIEENVVSGTDRQNDTAEQTPNTTQKEEATTETDQSQEADTGEVLQGLDLVQNSKGETVFERTYQVRELPADVIGSVKEFDVENLDYALSSANTKTLDNILDDTSKIVDGLNAKLQKDIKRAYGDQTIEGILKDNNAGNANVKDVQAIRQGRVLPLIAQSSLESGVEYNRQLIELAVMAAQNFVLTKPSSTGITKEEDIIQALNLPADTQITSDMWDVMNYGRSATDVKEELARDILDFWGAKANANISQTLTKGIAEGVADEILDYFSSLPETDPKALFQKRTIKADLGGGIKSYAQFKSNTEYSQSEEMKEMGPARSILQDIFVPNTSTIHQFSIGEKIPFAPDTLKKDSNVQLPSKKIKAIENQQKTEFKASVEFLDMIEFIGENNLAEILGFVDVATDNLPYSDYHLKSIEGKNISIGNSINNMLDMMAAVKAYADKNGVDFGDVPVHYRYEVSLNGRYFQSGFGPQNDKLIRELMTANKTTIDIEADSDIFYAAVAQAFELKIENLGISNSAAAAKEMVESTFREAIDILKDPAIDDKSKADFTRAVINSGEDGTPRLLKALFSVAQYELAAAKGEKTLEIDLPLELDGKTNGPISAAIQNNVGGFNEEFLALARRGGFFVGGEGLVPQTYAEFALTDNSADLYEVVGDVKSKLLADFNLDLKRGTKSDASHVQGLLRAQSTLLEAISEMGDISFTKSRNETDVDGIVRRIPGELKVKRRGTKSPITQNLYGAGGKSIAAGITNAIFKTVYEEITTALQTNDYAQLERLAGLMDTLGSISIEKDFKTGLLSTVEGRSGKLGSLIKDPAALESFVFPQSAFTNITGAIENLYISSFTDALETTVGKSVGDVNESLKGATQTHSEIFKFLADKALAEAREENKPEGQSGIGDELSSAARNKVLGALRKFAPIVDVSNSIFDLSGGQTEVSSQSRSETLSGKRSQSKVRGITTAGVRILPYNVIANADVSMITDTYTNPKMDLQSLAVHDGIETTLTSVKDTSLVMNEAVMKSWQTNTIKPVLDSVLSVLELKSEMNKAGVDPELISDLQNHADQLQVYSDFRDARIDALSKVHLAVDGVPGAEASFVQEGKKFTSEAELVEFLNNTAKESLKSNTAIKGKELGSDIEVEGSNSKLRESLGNEEISADIFGQILRANIAETGSSEQSTVIDELLKSPAFQDAKDAGLTVQVEKASAVGGRFDMDTNTLFISNVTNETALHELVHATTAFQVEAHYLAPETNTERGKAITRLESLMNDFASRDYKAGSVEALVQSEIRNGLAKNDHNGRIEALNEFMAWSLSNNKLIQRAKRTVASDPLSQVKALGRRGLQLMQRILGFRSVKAFDHILFNTSIVLNSDQTQSKNVNPIVQRAILNQSRKVGDARIAEINANLQDKITRYLENRTLERGQLKESVMLDAEARSQDSIQRLEAAGYSFTNEESNLFRNLQAMFSAAGSMDTDKRAVLEAQKIFTKLAEVITVDDFFRAIGTTVENATQSEEFLAETLHAALFGEAFYNRTVPTNGKPSVDLYGNSDRLATFLALTQTDSRIREMLADMDLKDLGVIANADNSSVDAFIDSHTRRTMQHISGEVINPGKENTGVRNALDDLTHILSLVQLDNANETEAAVAANLGSLNAKVANAVENTGESIATKSREFSEKTDNKFASIVAETAAALGDALVTERASAQVDTLTNLLNNKKVPKAIRELLTEIRGRTSDNAGVFDLVKKAKQFVSSVRQEYRETLPKIFASKFSDKFNNITKERTRSDRDADWSAMFSGLGETDITQLDESLGLKLFGSSDAKQLLRDSEITKAKAKVSQRLNAMGFAPALQAKLEKAYAAKAKQLGNYMVTKNAGINLLRSADAIVALLNEDGLSVSQNELAALKANESLQNKDQNFRAVRESIDVLATLYAVDSFALNNQKASNRLNVLVRSEPEGVKYVLRYMKDLRSNERAKADIGHYSHQNSHKGFMDSAARQGRTLVVAENTDHDAMVKSGFTRISDYQGIEDAVDGNNTQRGYYFSTQGGLANYNQGALQTVRKSLSGADPVTGFTIGGRTSGRITGDRVKLLNKRIKNAQGSTVEGLEQLLPVFGADGSVVAYERAVNPELMSNLGATKNFADSLANWSGRIIEEAAAEGLNQSLMEAVHDAWVNREPGTDAEFIIFEPGNPEFDGDPILKDSYGLIPPETKAYIKELFDGPLRIRRDVANNALGFRSASVSDIFTGKSRLPEQMQDAIEDILLSTVGPKARKYLTTAENVVQTVVAEVKHSIVVKSVVILGANTLSNVVQLAGREVPLSFMAKRTKIKYAEVAQFKRNEAKKIKLKADMLASRDGSEVGRIKAQIAAIEDSERRMTIWPLINNGEFTTISEGLTDSDQAFMNGRFVDWIEAKAAELPGGLSTAARYAIVSKDTALYQGLARGVQYSDFIAKAVYYDFLLENKKVSEADALAKITEEFINYDLLDGRTRTYSESMGVTWFLNFKLRAIKIAIDLMRNNPVTAFGSVIGLNNMLNLDVGTVITDNFVSAGLDGRLKYSVGPGMVGAAVNLNVWNQIFN